MKGGKRGPPVPVLTPEEIGIYLGKIRKKNVAAMR